MTRSSSQPEKKHQQQELFTGQVGRDLFMVFSKLLLGCADNRSELHCKDKRDPGDESRGIRLLWFRFGRQPTLIFCPPSWIFTGYPL